MNTIFSDTRSYIIDKKRRKFNSGQKFRIYNDRRECIGFITHERTFFQKLIGLNSFPFAFGIRNVNGVMTVLLTRKQGVFCTEIVIKDASGKKVGSIERNCSLFRRNIKILNAADNVIAKIYGNKKDLCFDITNSAENKIGEIKQREDSIRSRIKYDSIIDEIYSEVDDKIAILASVFAINMFF